MEGLREAVCVRDWEHVWLEEEEAMEESELDPLMLKEWEKEAAGDADGEGLTELVALVEGEGELQV